MAYISRDEIHQIISQESTKVFPTHAKNVMGRTIAGIVLKSIRSVDKSLESDDLRVLITNNINQNIMDSIKPTTGISTALESGTVGDNMMSRSASVVHRYVSQEMALRVENLRIKYRSEEGSEDRATVVADIVKTFEDGDLNLYLSEGMNEELSEITKESDDVVAEVRESVLSSMKETEEKNEVTRAVVEAFKETSEKVKAQQEILNNTSKDLTNADGGIGGNSTESFVDTTDFVKAKFPVTASRFKVMNDRKEFTYESIIRNLRILDKNTQDLQSDMVFVNTRIDSVEDDIINEHDIELKKSFDEFESIFKKAEDDFVTANDAYKVLGFGRGEGKAQYVDSISTDMMKDIYKYLDGNVDYKKTINAQILSTKPKQPVTVNEVVKIATEALILRSLEDGDIPSFDELNEAIEVRDEIVGEFIISGQSADYSDRVRKIKNSYKQIAKVGGIGIMDKDTIQKQFYATAKVLNTGDLIDFDQETNKIKQMIAEEYGTKKYDPLVDEVFGVALPSGVSVENLYEAFAIKAAREYSRENQSLPEGAIKKQIGTYATVYSTFIKTLESLNIVDKQDLNALVISLRS